jgi:hypothetical protein
MEEQGAEIIILYVDRRFFGRAPEIWSGEPAEPIDPAWAAISRCSQADRDDEFVLYFLDCRGHHLVVLQFETLEIVLDQANDLAAISRDAWRACEEEVDDEANIDVRRFA